MTIQARAAHTRGELVHAAAVEFDRVGYEGARVARISAGASVSLGALTFHFSSKAALADAVGQEGRLHMEALLDGLGHGAEPAGVLELEEVVTLTVRLAGLLEENVVVRSAARLSVERPQEVGSWTDAWLPRVLDLLERARSKGQLGTDEDLRAMAIAVTHLVEGVVSRIRIDRAASDGSPVGASDQLRQVWRLIERGIARQAA